MNFSCEMKIVLFHSPYYLLSTSKFMSCYSGPSQLVNLRLRTEHDDKVHVRMTKWVEMCIIRISQENKWRKNWLTQRGKGGSQLGKFEEIRKLEIKWYVYSFSLTRRVSSYTI